MTEEPDLNTKHVATVLLVQAMRGAISPNFRMIALRFSVPDWELLFVLEKDDPIDRDEIDDIDAEFAGLLLGHVADVIIQTEVRIDDQPLPLMDNEGWRVVYRRRETD